jgi:predicted glycosyltransferase
VHSDPRFARLEESFRPRITLRAPVRHTGFVVPEREVAPSAERQRRVIVSAGGGLVGAPLLRAALEAAPLLPPDLRLEVVAGPFLPEEEWEALRRAADGLAGVEVHRFAPDLGTRIRSAAASVSQCGYNTALDLIRAGVPALVVPFADGREDEQARRAERLERQGVLRILPSERLEPATLAREIVALLDFEPRRIDLDLTGAETSATLLADLVRAALPAEAAAR